MVKRRALPNVEELPSIFLCKTLSRSIAMGFEDQKIPANLNFEQRLVLRDQELVLAAQAGSTAAFAELQKLYWEKLYRTVIGITKNREDAEDALQDTFLRAFVALCRFEGRSSVYSWLTRIAINSALMILRKRRIRAEVLFDSPSDNENGIAPIEIRDAAPNPEQLCDLRQRSSGILLAIRRLEPKLRAPIEIQLTHECSMKEIARTLDISVAAVKARLHRARGRLTKTRVLRHSGGKEHLLSA
jgi:RNA polymerase sigma-70 factor (ECF subfamily)